MTLTRFVRSFVSHNPATTEIYTLSLHDALPISRTSVVISRFLFVMTITSLQVLVILGVAYLFGVHPVTGLPGDRKSTRLNSSHANISYAVFCLKKKISDTFQRCCCTYIDLSEVP